jgi:hypothetical protein
MRGKGLAQILWNVSPVTDFGAVLTSPGAKRLECVELAPAFGTATLNESASELDALQTLRVTAMSTFLRIIQVKRLQVSRASYVPLRRGGVNEIQLAGAQIN